MANLTLENWSATCFSASASRKPAPMTRLYFCAANVVKFGT